MNTAQRKYAVERVGYILNTHLATLKTNHTVAERTLTSAERLDLLRTGTVKLRTDINGVTNSSYVQHVFDFSAYENRETVDAGYEPAAAALRLQASAIRDKIMLGDSEEAIALLASFERG